MPTLLIWAGYSRVSRVGDRAERLLSPDLQAERILGYARGRGIEVQMQDPELDVSGGRVDRPILGRVIEGIEAGAFAGVIVAQLDRLSRLGIGDALALIQRIESAGGEVIAVAENFDAGTPEGRLVRNFFLSLAEMQLDRYKLQFRAAKGKAVAEGRWVNRTAPIGYQKVHRKDGGDGKLYLDPKAAQKVVRSFEMRVSGASWREVADFLGVSMTGAGKVIRNRVYLGEVKLGEWVNPDAHEAIVSRELWEAAQLGHPRPPRSAPTLSLMSGLVRCAGCQRVMSPQRFAKGGPIYRCHAHNSGGYCQSPAIISMRKLDEYVEAVMLAHFSRVEVNVSRRSERLDEALRALEVAEAELVAFQEVTAVLSEGAESFVAGIRKRLHAVEQAREAVGNARASAPLPDLGSLAGSWPTLTVSERNHVLRGALGAVFVRKGRGDARYRVRLVAAGFAKLPRAGDPVVPLDDRRLEGEIGVPPA